MWKLWRSGSGVTRALSRSARVGGAPDLLDVDLRHPEHRGHRALRPCLVRVRQQPLHLAGHDLPRDAEPVLDPAAGPLLTAVDGEGVPVVVDVGLVRAVDLEGDRLVEAELRASVE